MLNNNDYYAWRMFSWLWQTYCVDLLSFDLKDIVVLIRRYGMLRHTHNHPASLAPFNEKTCNTGHNVKLLIVSSLDSIQMKYDHMGISY